MRITIKLMLILALMSTPAFAANLFVGPGSQFDTIQAAVDAASPGDRILVAAGNYAGARIDKWVKISGAGDATVINDAFFPGVRFRTAFEIVSGADKTQISDLTIALLGPPDTMLTGINVRATSGLSPIKGVIRNVKFVDLARAILIRNSSGWIITGNVISGLRDPYWSSLASGIWLNGTGNSLVANNTVESDVFALPHLIFVGINLSAGGASGHVDNNKIVNNTVSVRAIDAFKVNDIELFQSATHCDDVVLIVANKVISNQADSILLTPPCLADHNVVH